MDEQSRICSKIQNAVRANIPVIYIKTSSFEQIRELIAEKRPVSVLVDKESGKIKNWKNYCKKIADDVNKEDFDLDVDNWKSVQIRTVPMDLFGPDAENTAMQTLLQQLYQYVMKYYDPLYQNRDYMLASVLILYSETIRIPDSFLQYTEIIEAEFPQREEISGIITDCVEQYGEEKDQYAIKRDRKAQERMEWLCNEFAGFRKHEIGCAMRKILTREMPDTDLAEESRLLDTVEIKEIIKERKLQKMQGTQVLRLIVQDQKQEIGGMKVLQSWITKKARFLSDAEKYRNESGVLAPKGILVCGIPGCGKSMAAKAAAKEFGGIPLLQLDVGSLMGRYVGESEENIRKALMLAEAMSPCVLWIDELEKGFSGASEDSKDGGTFSRMFGTLLNWMQENEKPCFIFATANDIGGLPKEFFRSGRFDEIFAMYLPTAEECADIFVKQAEARIADARNRRKPLFDRPMDHADYLKFIDENLVSGDKPRIVIGSDIQKIVNTALMKLAEKRQDEKRDASASIYREEWLACLKMAVDECSVYGDGEENVDSIAVSYCRMLRKGMKPTADQTLFKKEDYEPKNLDKKTDSGKPEKILKKRDQSLQSKYDRKVYNILYHKINRIAPDVEEIEMDKMLERRK